MPSTDPINVYWDPNVPLLITSSVPPITHIASLKIVQRAPGTPTDALFRVENMAARDFWWFSPSGSPLLKAGQPRYVTYKIGFQWDVYGVWGADDFWFVAFQSATALLVTPGAYLVDRVRISTPL